MEKEKNAQEELKKVERNLMKEFAKRV